MKKQLTTLLVILFLGLIVRLFFIPNPGFEADVAYWKSWSLAAADKGPLWTVLNTNYNYPPVFIYLLWVLGKAYSLFANPHDFAHFWQDTNFLFLFLAKLIPIISDILIAVLLFFLGRRFICHPEESRACRETTKDLERDSSPALRGQNDNRFSLPLLMAGLYLFNPVSILDGSIWGQVDSFGVLIFLTSLVLLFLKKPFWASAVFTLSFLLKLQNIIYIPIFFLFILLKFGKKTFFKSLTVSAAAFFFLCLEYFLKNEGPTIIKLMLQNADWFPYLSLNSYNIWWIVSNANGMGVSDKILSFGIVNAKTMGLILFSGSYLLCLGLLFKKASFKNLILSCLLAVFSFYLLLTQAHERYIFPAIVFLILLLPYFQHNCHSERSEESRRGSFGLQPQDDNALRKNTSKVQDKDTLEVKGPWKVFFIALTITAFYNLHNAFVHFYPQNGLPLLSSLNIKALTMLVSFINITLFCGLLIFLFTKVHLLFSLLSLGFVGFSLIFLNSSYFFKKEVSLTSLKPIREVSAFARCQKNMTVNSNFGWKHWNRLSSSYFFYKKGFGCHANSELGFDLDRKFAKFSTDYGVDTEAGVNASVIFKIFADEKLLFESEKMGRFDFPKHIEVDIQGAKRLTLTIENARDGNRDDHGDWLKPVLYKK